MIKTLLPLQVAWVSACLVAPPIKTKLLTFSDSRGCYLKPHTLVITLYSKSSLLTPKNRKALCSS